MRSVRSTSHLPRSKTQRYALHAITFLHILTWSTPQEVSEAELCQLCSITASSVVMNVSDEPSTSVETPSVSGLCDDQNGCLAPTLSGAKK